VCHDVLRIIKSFFIVVIVVAVAYAAEDDTPAVLLSECRGGEIDREPIPKAAEDALRDDSFDLFFLCGAYRASFFTNNSSSHISR